MFFLAPDSIAVKNIASTFSEATGVIAPSFYVSMSHQDGLDADSFFFFFPQLLVLYCTYTPLDICATVHFY